MAEELRDILNDLPPELNDDSAGDTTTTATVDDTGDDTTGNDTTTEDDQTGDDTTETEEGDDATGDGDTTTTDEEDQSEYVVDSTEEDDTTTTTPPAAGDQPKTQDEFVLAGLQKLSVRVIGPDDKIHTIQAYGNGDLPRDMKAFATKYEEKIWDTQVAAQEQKARDLVNQFQTRQRQADTDQFVRRENMAIRDDLNDLIKEGTFPKFKGTPGSREFEDSDGGKEFDKVIKFMNEQNQRYSEVAQKGRAYRHIGFREAFIMLNGPNPKADEKTEDAARKKVAKKLKSGGGTDAGKRNVSTKPVAKLTDLVDEFAAFAGSTS